MEHSFFLTNAISNEMIIFGSNDRRKSHDHQDFDRSSVYWPAQPVSVMSNINHDREGIL